MTQSTPSSDARAGGEAIDRRTFGAYLAMLGLGATALPSTLSAEHRPGEDPALLSPEGPLPPSVSLDGDITRETLQAAETLMGLRFTDGEREMMLEALSARLELFEQLRSVSIPNEVPPAIRFDPVLPGDELPTERKPFRISRQPPIERPSNLERLAFLPVTRLSELIRTRQVTSVELTSMYLDRLRRYQPDLYTVVTFTEDRAMDQARRADQEIRLGRYRGPLHGIPWGVKDLLAVSGYPTSWGAEMYKDRVLEYEATIVRRLDEAGAVLVAKLSTGTLADLDRWFGVQTRNPWNPDIGSGGSSAGPASATAAGLVAFGIGTDTGGSITHPSSRCGVTGLRPSMGRVSRHGCMPLAWSTDKIGPICRAVEDAAVVLDAIQGPDGQDLTCRDIPLNWDPDLDVKGLRVGYVRRAYEDDSPTRALDLQVLEELRGLGIDPIAVDLPADFPLRAMRLFILYAEGAAGFDEMTRTDLDDQLDNQGPNDWPNQFRIARFIPAVEYVQAQRLRTMMMGTMRRVMQNIDVLVTPYTGPDYNNITVFSGQPIICLPSGVKDDGMPASTVFIGNLYREGEMLAVAKAYQDATGWHLRQPPRFSV